MWFVVGVGLMMVGVALCLLGPIRLPGGRVLRTRYAQLCGAILLCYFPLVFLLRPHIEDWDDTFKQMLNAGLASFCVLLVLFIIVRSTRQPRPARKYGVRPPAAGQPFG